MAGVLTAECPKCKCPDQHCGMLCGFCHTMIPEPSDVVIEEVIGYKGFRVARIGDWITDHDFNETAGPLLVSPMFPTPIMPGEWAIAHCAGGHGNLPPEDPQYHGPDTDDRSKWSPVKGCGGAGHGCGFYAGRSWNHLVELGYSRWTHDHPAIICKIQMQGKIIPATNGYRAQQIRPLVLYVPHELWRMGNSLMEVYGPHGVTMELSATTVAAKAGTAEAVEWCKKCTARLKRSMTCPVCGHHNI